MVKRIILLILSLGCSLGLFSQEYQEGIPWGNAYFKPSIEFIYTHSDNIFRVDPSIGNKMDDNIWMIRPQIGFEFPFENSYINLTVQYEYKDYEDYNLLHHSTWFGKLESQFKFANRSILTFKNHYVQGVQQTEEFDPDMEVYWSTSRFSKNNSSLAYSIPVSRYNDLGFHINYLFVNFKSDSDSGRLPFFSYDQLSTGLTWKYNYQPLSSFLFEWEHTKSEPIEDNYFYRIVGLYTTPKRYNEDKFLIGWSGNEKRKITGFAKIGFKEMRFDDYLNISYKDYRGLVVDAGFAFKMDHFTDLNVTVFRHANQSSFNVNNYYTASGLAMRLHHQFSRRFFATVGANYQKNNYTEAIDKDINNDGYPETMLSVYLEGQKRKDSIFSFLTEIGYHFSPRMSFRVNYFYEKRDCNLTYIFQNAVKYPFSYKENRLIFQILMGW